jgi:hypothetical protein
MGRARARDGRLRPASRTVQPPGRPSPDGGDSRTGGHQDRRGRLRLSSTSTSGGTVQRANRATTPRSRSGSAAAWSVGVSPAMSSSTDWWCSEARARRKTAVGSATNRSRGRPGATPGTSSQPPRSTMAPTPALPPRPPGFALRSVMVLTPLEGDPAVAIARPRPNAGPDRRTDRRRTVIGSADRGQRPFRGGEYGPTPVRWPGRS